MILPDVRASFGRDEGALLVHLLEERGEDGDAMRDALAERGIDPLLDHPVLARAVLEGRAISPLPLEIVSYVLLRRCLLEAGVDDRVLADYLTSLFLQFGESGRANRIAPHDEQEYGYLVDLLEEISGAKGQRSLLLRAHLGNLSLWLSGLFPDWIDNRVNRRGGPGLDYYEEMGQTGFALAADEPLARETELDSVFRAASNAFVPMRRALNGFSDRFLTPRPTSPVDRLLREVRDRFEAGWLQA
ncbi:MAG: hypothetical protein OEU54_00885 [Gemmatimonadota bacterium]|nr:hypothetical protein [Gemmatimonadota bacterium]